MVMGSHYRGGDNSAVQERLRDVQQMQASDDAFAAILAMDPWWKCAADSGLVWCCAAVLSIEPWWPGVVQVAVVVGCKNL